MGIEALEVVDAEEIMGLLADEIEEFVKYHKPIESDEPRIFANGYGHPLSYFLECDIEPIATKPTKIVEISQEDIEFLMNISIH